MAAFLRYRPARFGAFGRTLAAAATVTSARTSLTLDNGVYTPTGTTVANVDSITPAQAIYQRNGSVVTVSGYVAINPTAAASTFTQAGLSLPIASNFVDTLDLSGVATSFSGQVGAIQADATNDRAMIEFNSGTTADTPFRYVFQYVIK
jgi:hypothetical protein